jgi:2-polyprenyl-3-methyl-5-hydroxy-6-metoxy-1,4-benzoquinol methylase
VTREGATDVGTNVEGGDMADDPWSRVREGMERQEVLLGPYFSHQLVHKPRHLLFVLARYKFAARMLPPLESVDVLELGCSEGLGAHLMAERHRVTGVDSDEDAVTHARRLLGRPGLSFVHSDFLGRTFGTFRAVVSVDVIEHVPREKEDLFMETVRANLGPEGLCVIGTPNAAADAYASPESRIGHVNLFSAERLMGLVSRYFHNILVFGMNDEMAHTGFYPMCHYLFVVGCGPRASQA